jgi:hypothetical protein
MKPEDGSIGPAGTGRGPEFCAIAPPAVMARQHSTLAVFSFLNGDFLIIGFCFCLVACFLWGVD